MYSNKLCHILGRGDLISSARFLPLHKLRLHHVLPSVLSNKAKKEAQLVVVKVSCSERATLKDVFADVDYSEHQT